MTQLTYLLSALLLALSLGGCSKQTAEEKGKEMATEKIDMVKGVGEALKESGKQATESLAHGVGNATKGIGAGLEAASAFEFTLNPSMAQNGLSVNRMQPGKGEENAVSVYIISKQAVAGRMTLYAYGKKKIELGRVSRELKLAANGAVYEDFSFDGRTQKALMENIAVDFEPAQVH